MSMTTEEIIELAKQGGKLSSDKQWILADELVELTAFGLTQVAIASGRNESTLFQYARAAERWVPADRVEGVSFSAHRVALSWHDPRQLLVDLKRQFGSPTVKQVRTAMGLEPHPTIDHLRKAMSKLDDKVSTNTAETLLSSILLEVEAIKARRAAKKAEIEATVTNAVEEPSPVEETPTEETDTDSTITRWEPKVRTADVAGL